MPPNETLFLESTARIQKDPMQYEPPPLDHFAEETNDIRSSFMDFQVWDFPGQLDFLDPQFDIETIFGETGALIWVIDAQDEYLDAIQRLNNTILNLQRSYPLINIEVFIHKVDGLSDDYRQDIQRDIMQRIQDELSDSGIENAPINFHLTSIYNHSIFEAFSKVIQKLIPHLPTLEALLNDLCRNCRFEKAYLFDVLSKIYIATDSSPVDMPSYEICSDYIDVVVDISEIYGWERSPEYIKALEGEPWNKPIVDQLGCAEAESCIVLKDGAGDKRAGINIQAGEIGGRPVILREVNKYLALVAVMREGSYAKMPAVGLNIESVCEGLKEVFEITKRK